MLIIMVNPSAATALLLISSLDCCQQRKFKK